MGRYKSSGMRLKRRGESRFDMEWRYAVGWLFPEAKLEEKFSISPREARGHPLPWWRVIGPETRCPLKWRRDLRRASCYALSSATFAAVGFAGLFFFGASRRDAALLTAVAVTSLQADVTYLGVDHAWRTADTLLAVALIARYVGLAVARAFDGGAATLDSDDAILISSHGYISGATGGGAEGIPNRWGPGPDGWVDVRVDLDTHYVSIASCVDRNGHISLSVLSLRRRLRKGEALVPVVGVVAGSDAQLLPLVDTSGPPPWVPDQSGPFENPHHRYLLTATWG